MMQHASQTGQPIVITRAAHQYHELAHRVRGEGGVPLPYPTIALAPPDDSRPLDSGLRAAASGAFDWLVITSANTAHSLSERLRLLNITHLPVRIAAIGTGTAAAIATCLHRTPDCLPAKAGSAALIAALPLRPGARVLLPQSELADDALVVGLMQCGASVTAVQAYRVVTGEGGIDLPRLLPRDPERYILTFTSGSTVDHFMLRYTREGGSLDAVRAASLVIMGASTARALKTHALSPTAHAPENDLNALMHAIKGLIHA